MKQQARGRLARASLLTPCAAAFMLAALSVPSAALAQTAPAGDACQRDVTEPQPGYRIVDGTVVTPSGAELSGGEAVIGQLGLHGGMDGTYARTFFEDSCGERYQVGYRLEDNTLHFPGGGTHELPEGDEDTAEDVLRQTYGLVGERDALMRTRW